MNEQNGLAVREEATAQLSVVRDDFKFALEPANLKEAMVLAEKLATASGTSPFDMMMKIGVARDLGVTWSQAQRAIHMIEGKPALEAAFIHGLCLQRKDICAKFKLESSTDKKAVFRVRRADWDASEPDVLHEFGIEEANQAGLNSRGEKSNWSKYPKRMLEARAKSTAARLYFPEICYGLYTADELIETIETTAEEIPKPRQVTVAVATPAVVVDDTEAMKKEWLDAIMSGDQAKQAAWRKKAKDHPSRQTLGEFYNANLPPEAVAKKQESIVAKSLAKQEAEVKPMRQPGED